MTKDCPNCELVNSSNAQRCDCGYSFSEQASASGQKIIVVEANQNENFLYVSPTTISIGFLLTACLMIIIDNLIIPAG